MPLCLVGAGISGTSSIPADGKNAICNAEIIYYEQFTSPSPSDDNAMHGAIRGMAQSKSCEIRDAKRWMVEDGTSILDDSRDRRVVLLSYGDPLVATTHIDLLCRAAKQGIAVRVIHASSGPTAIVGECGLHHYKMGRMATIMRKESSMTTPYYTVYKNAVERSHTLLLLEYDYEGTEYGDGCSFALDPAEALRGLLRTERGQQRHVITEDTYAIVASRIGMNARVPGRVPANDTSCNAAMNGGPDDCYDNEENPRHQCITAGRISSLMARGNFGEPPHSIIIPGRLHFTESDALGILAECIDPPPTIDTNDMHDDAPVKAAEPHLSLSSHPNEPARIAEQMVAKYAPMVRASAEEAAEQYANDHNGKDIMLEILENAKRYVSDAEDFVRKEGYEDVAVLSIGYADGLADAVRQMCKMGPGSGSERVRAASAAVSMAADPANTDDAQR